MRIVFLNKVVIQLLCESSVMLVDFNRADNTYINIVESVYHTVAASCNATAQSQPAITGLLLPLCFGACLGGKPK